MPNIKLDDLTPETQERIALIQARAAFRDGETLRLRDIFLGLVELGSVRAIQLMEEQSDHDFQ